MKRLATTLSALLLASQSYAQEIIVGLGYSDFSLGGANDTFTAEVEYHLKPFEQGDVLSIGLGGVLSADSSQNIFVGFGLTNKFTFDSPWFIELSLMPGAFFEGNRSNDLGHTLEFRSVLAFGYRFADNAAISLGLQHKSNAGITTTNPGVNTLTLRYHHYF